MWDQREGKGRSGRNTQVAPVSCFAASCSSPSKTQPRNPLLLLLPSGLLQSTIPQSGNSLVVQRLRLHASTADSPGLIPRELRFHEMQCGKKKRKGKMRRSVLKGTNSWEVYHSFLLSPVLYTGKLENAWEFHMRKKTQENMKQSSELSIILTSLWFWPMKKLVGCATLL